MYNNAYQDYLNRMKSGAMVLGLILILICGALAFLSIPANAKTDDNTTLYINEITEDSINWNYTYLTDNRPIGATFDGIIIEGFKTDFVFNYTASDLKPNTSHEFCLFDGVGANCERGYTLPESETGLNDVFSILYLYICAIIAVIFLFIALSYKQNEIALVAGLLSFVGLGIVGENLIAQIIYALILISAFYVTFKE